MQYNMVYYCKFIQFLHEREELFFVEFNVNSPALFVIAGLIIAAVLAQSVYFLIKAWKRGLAIGMGKEKLRRIARTAAVFTIAPAVAIVISVITLAKDLGVPLPWLRLSVVGSLSYETIAASNAEGAMGLVFGQVDSLTASQYVTIAWVMTHQHHGGHLAGGHCGQAPANRHDQDGKPRQKVGRYLLRPRCSSA